MEATITTLGDVFKKKVDDSIVLPTIWVDVEGHTHEDTLYAMIDVSDMYRAMVYTYPAINDTDNQFYLQQESKKFREGNYETGAVFKGDILSLGSHVFSCGAVIQDPNSTPIDKKFDINKIFAHAKNLVNLSSTFDSDFSEILSNIKPSLFSGCPNLVRLDSVFAHSELKEIPSGLFDKNLNLKYLDQTFMFCKHLTEIPEDLFKNNDKIKSLHNCFLFSGITNVPVGLLKHLDPNCRFDSMFSGTPFAEDLKEREVPIEVIRDLYFPDQTPLFDVKMAL